MTIVIIVKFAVGNKNLRLAQMHKAGIFISSISGIRARDVALTH